MQLATIAPERLHERLDCLRERVFGVRHERIEAVAKRALPDKLQRSAAHPANHVDILRSGLDAKRDCGLELSSPDVSKGPDAHARGAGVPLRRLRRRMA